MAVTGAIRVERRKRGRRGEERDELSCTQIHTTPHIHPLTPLTSFSHSDFFFFCVTLMELNYYFSPKMVMPFY